MVFKPYHLVEWKEGSMSGLRIEVTPEYGHVDALPVKRGILTGKKLVYPLGAIKQATQQLSTLTRLYYDS